MVSDLVACGLLERDEDQRVRLGMRLWELALRGSRALRLRQAQHFSWWMTSMLHLEPGASDFDRLRQIGELRSVVESRSGRAHLAEAYTGWPL